MSAASTTKHVVFDVVGTLVSYDCLFQAIEERLGDRLRAEGIKPTLFGHLWIEVSEREYTYLSMYGSYTSYAAVFPAIFWRMLFKAGIDNPRAFASQDDLDAIMQGYSDMRMRPDAAECVRKLRDAGFTVWGFTMDDPTRVGGFFADAGVPLPQENLFSCDKDELAKPDPGAYEPVFDRLRNQEAAEAPWFAAAHMWDVRGAMNTGFKGAYCTVWELEPLPELFGKADVEADDLVTMANRIVEAST